MKEKSYPIHDEEPSPGKACEPSLATAYRNRTELKDVPVLGPSTWEAALDDLDQSEREYEAGESIPWNKVMGEIKRNYGIHIY